MDFVVPDAPVVEWLAVDLELPGLETGHVSGDDRYLIHRPLLAADFDGVADVDVLLDERLGSFRVNVGRDSQIGHRLPRRRGHTGSH